MQGGMRGILMTTSLTFPLRWHTQLNGSWFYQGFAKATLQEVVGTFIVKCPDHPLREVVRSDEVNPLSDLTLLADGPFAQKIYAPIFEEALRLSPSLDKKVAAIEHAARRFGELTKKTPSREVVDERRYRLLATLLVARELANGTSEVKQEASDALTHFIDALPKGSPENYELAARLVAILCNPKMRDGMSEHLLGLLAQTVKNFKAGAPEVYHLAGLPQIRTALQNEGPAFDIVTNEDTEVSTTVILHEQLREAELEGRVYRTIATAFSPERDDTFGNSFEEAASMALYAADYFLGSGGKHYFVRPAALNAFLKLMPMIGKNARSKELVKDLAKRLNTFIKKSRKDPLTRPHEVDVAFAVMDGMKTLYPAAVTIVVSSEDDEEEKIY